MTTERKQVKCYQCGGMVDFEEAHRLTIKEWAHPQCARTYEWAVQNAKRDYDLADDLSSINEPWPDERLTGYDALIVKDKREDACPECFLIHKGECP